MEEFDDVGVEIPDEWPEASERQPLLIIFYICLLATGLVILTKDKCKESFRKFFRTSRIALPDDESLFTQEDLICSPSSRN